MGYQRNEYDWCVMKTIVNDKQCTTIWHVDDLKMLHVNTDIVSSVLADIYGEYRNIGKMDTQIPRDEH